jgi:hypothetical protein
MRQSETIGALAKALCAAQGELKPAAMNSTNPFLKSKYADLGSVIDAAKPVLAKHGLSYSQLVEGGDGPIAVTTILMHESGEWLSSMVGLPMAEERGKSAAQVAGSIITYLRRYALSAVLGIYADEDTDGHAPQAPQARQTRARAESAPESTPPPTDAPQTPLKATTRARMFALFTELGITDEKVQRGGMATILGHPVTSRGAVTNEEAKAVIASLEARKEAS